MSEPGRSPTSAFLGPGEAEAVVAAIQQGILARRRATPPARETPGPWVRGVDSVAVTAGDRTLVFRESGWLTTKTDSNEFVHCKLDVPAAQNLGRALLAWPGPAEEPKTPAQIEVESRRAQTRPREVRVVTWCHGEGGAGELNSELSTALSAGFEIVSQSSAGSDPFEAVTVWTLVRDGAGR